ncbi:MAG: excinuclease ABC subunit UvrC [Chloroflexi bacterium]|nr:excinuclease ABC subunit UvrC [Chloroflexota bacterium]
MVMEYVAEQVKQLPTKPGVYLMKDARGNIIYVGKAASLRDRVKSYFGAPENLTAKTQLMVEKVHDVDFFVTNSEEEALVLELNLIKQYRPHYNVRLKDDKTFPYLKIDTTEDWPRIYVTRRLEEGTGRYFGPFASAKSIRQTVKVLRRLFPFRSCTRPITGADKRACLEYYVHNCVAPCIGAVSKEEYREVIREVILFLEGKEERLVRKLEAEMQKAAETLNFEKAALLRDQIQSVRRVVEEQRIATKVKGEQDVIALAAEKDQACVQVFFIRNSKIIGRESYVLQGTRDEAPPQIMANFIKQFYDSSPYVPPLLLLQYPVEDAELIERWLESRRGSRVNIQVPQRGNKRELVALVAENARQALQQLKIKTLALPSVLEDAMMEVKEKLNLPSQPARIEGYDISDIQGAMAVGSMVVFEDGKAKPAHYRRFKIKTVPGADDFAMINEVVKRRFKRVKEGVAEGSWAIVPDLVLIDGGRGQLNAALDALRETGASDVSVASLAKEREEIFVPEKAEPIVLPGNSPALQLLQRVRDEAHRFALGYHRKLRKKETFASSLNAIPGIGPKRRRALLKQFGTVSAIREAPIEELVAVKGMSESLARKVKEIL